MPRPHRPRRLLVAAVATAALVGLGGTAIAVTAEPAIRTSTPKHEGDVTNIDVLRQQIANYYGDPLKTGDIGIDSNYVREVQAIERKALRYLRHAKADAGMQKAIVLDVDDTSLVTWNYEVEVNWAYDSQPNAAYVTEQRFPPVPGMVRLVKKAKALGYRVFFLTGRGADQEAATLGDLTKDGVGVDAAFPGPTDPDGSGPEDGLCTEPEPADHPQYLQDACGGAACSTVEYKTATREHIESLGFDVVASFGDQRSDLKGGFAGRRFKLPNSNYFLP